MTAPIQEPNIYRHASGLQFGQNQLFRRPAPVTEGAEYPYVFRKHDSTITIGPGSLDYIQWDDDDFSQAGGYFTPGDSVAFDIEGPGVFDFLFGIVWDAPFNSKTMLQVQCDAFGNYPTQFGWGGFYSDGGTLLDGASQSWYIHFQARVASGASATAFAVSQANAAGQDILQAFARVAFITDWIAGSEAGAEADFVFL